MGTKRMNLLLCLTVVLLSLSMMASADTLAFTGSTFSALGVGSSATDAKILSFEFNTLRGTFISQVFTLNTGGYVYLYQLQNTGVSPVEKIVVSPFYQLTSAGYITNDQQSDYPNNFTAGGKTPYQLFGEYQVDYYAEGVNRVSWGYYGGAMGGQISSTQSSAVLYLISPNAPVIGNAGIIDGATANVECWVAAVPEPGTIIAAAALLSPAALMFRRRKTVVSK